MAEYALNTLTAVAVGASVPFNTTIVKGCCNIRHRSGSGSVKLKGGTCCRPNRYYVSFHGNVQGVQGLIQLAVYLDGDRLPETIMSVQSGGTTAINSVNTATEIEVDGCFSNVSVRVITGDTVSVNNANIIIHKEVA